MTKHIARYAVFVFLVLGLAAAPAAPAAAHTGQCTVTGNTWHDGSLYNTVYGSGNVECNNVHDKLYIKVTLEKEWNGWLSVGSAEKTDTDRSSIYKQTSYYSGFSPYYCTYRVRIFYKVWKGRDLNHSDTVYRAQQQHPCHH